MMSRIIYVVILTSIIGCFGECFGVDIHVGQPTKLAQDGTYFDLYKRLEVLEDLRSKDDRESIEIRRTVEVQKNSLDQVLADLSTIKDKFGKLQRENEFLHTRLNIALEMSEKCEKKCSASEKGTFQEYGDTPKSDLDVVPENGTELQGDSRRTGPKLATKETTFSKPNYSFHGIRSSQVHQTGMKRVAESDPLARGRGFFAKTTQTLSNVADGYIIIFNSVVTNIHGDYNGLTGAFTCGTPGLYVFSWTIHINIHWLISDLLKNGMTVAQAYSGDDQAYKTTGTNVAVLSLDRGDVITVIVNSRIASTIILPHITNFSGYLVV